jgi:hypothetical protein
MTFSNSDPVSVEFAGLTLKGIYINQAGENAIVKLSSGYNICVPEKLCTARAVEQQNAAAPVKKEAAPPGCKTSETLHYFDRRNHCKYR